MKNAFKDLLTLVLYWSVEAWNRIGVRGLWHGAALDKAARDSESTRPLNRSARRALLRQSKRLNRRDLGRVA